MSDERTPVLQTPWFSVVQTPLENGQPYYMLELPDYVSVVAATAAGDLVFVRQYRPVVAAYTIELPSGHVDPGESPEQAARRELLEETGFVADRMELLGTLVPDVGRLANRMWCFFAGDVRQAEPVALPEEGVTVELLSPREAFVRAGNGAISHALNLAVLLLAVTHKKLSVV